jgi:1,4-alpha-glucan branching enzyme
MIATELDKSAVKRGAAVKPSRSWGAELIDGGARFRIWAPHQNSVGVNVGHSRCIAMAQEGDGWWRLETDAVKVGRSYSFRLGSGETVPDPAARAQVDHVHGSSQLVDPDDYPWRSDGWRGRPWEEAVIYELHIGAFTPEGDFRAAAARLPYLADLGVTAVEIMPVAQFSGNRG